MAAINEMDNKRRMQSEGTGTWFSEKIDKTEKLFVTISLSKIKKTQLINRARDIKEPHPPTTYPKNFAKMKFIILYTNLEKKPHMVGRLCM